MSTLVIIHFAPLELYPPIQNLLRELASERKYGRVVVYTTRQASGHLKELDSPSSNITIVRLAKSGGGLLALTRYMQYFIFFTLCFLALALKRPGRILYFETISSWPVYLYRRYLGRPQIFIHYHEYNSPEDLKNGMKLVRFFHSRENWLYPRATLVSQTNVFRLEKFLTDILPVKIKQTSVLPNFPPRSWQFPPKLNLILPLKIVYAGALSIDTMFTTELCRWVIRHKDEVSWDIYSNNCAPEARQYIQSLKSDCVRLFEGVSYDELPRLLCTYDLGVVLYKGHIPNYIWNAPNKLFEYLACGLSVLVPLLMTGSLPYVTNLQYPSVSAVNFEQLDTVRPIDLLHGKDYVRSQASFFSDDALKPLLETLAVN